MQYEIKNSGKFKYVQEGQGERPVLLHGLFGALSNFKDLIDKLKNDKDLGEVKSLSELMSTDKGRRYWKENGFAFNGEFDLKEGSQSLFILNKYIEGKKNEKN